MIEHRTYGDETVPILVECSFCGYPFAHGESREDHFAEDCTAAPRQVDWSRISGARDDMARTDYPDIGDLPFCACGDRAWCVNCDRRGPDRHVVVLACKHCDRLGVIETDDSAPTFSGAFDT